MDSRDLELARLTFLKDLILAEFHAKVSKWEDFQAAALGLAGLGFIAYFTGAMDLGALLVVLGISSGAVLFAHVALERYGSRARRLVRKSS